MLLKLHLKVIYFATVISTRTKYLTNNKLQMKHAHWRIDVHVTLLNWLQFYGYFFFLHWAFLEIASNANANGDKVERQIPRQGT